MMKKILIIFSLFLLQACSLAPFGDKVQTAIDTAVDTGIEDRKAYNDKKATTIIAATCDVSIGAFYRLANTTQQKALAMLCSGLEPAVAPPSLTDGIAP
jgi:hypothetical protein